MKGHLGYWKKKWAILRDIGRHSEHDCHFYDPNNFCKESDSNDNEKHQNYQSERSREIEALRSSIAESLMNATTFVLNNFWIVILFEVYISRLMIVLSATTMLC